MNHHSLRRQMELPALQASSPDPSHDMPRDGRGHYGTSTERALIEDDNPFAALRSSAIVLLTRYARKPRRFVRLLHALDASNLDAARDLARWLCQSAHPAQRQCGKMLSGWCSRHARTTGSADADGPDSGMDDLFDLDRFDEESGQQECNEPLAMRADMAGNDGGNAERSGIPSLRDAGFPPPAPPAWVQPSDPSSQRALFSADEIEAYAATYQQQLKDGDERAAVGQVISQLRRSGVYRTLGTPGPNWREQIDQLEEQFPNCASYLDFLRAAFVLAEREGTAIQLDPVVLEGPPGVGKSLLAQRVADLLRTGCHTVQVAIAQDNSALGGSSRFWSNAHPGELFHALVYGQYANPVVVLDEIEKANADRYDPLGPLYTLLERDSAARFHDLCHPWLTIDASHIIWVATSNNVQLLPAPIRSRVRLFSIPAPTIAQATSIAVHLWQSLCTELPQATAGVQLTEEALAVLAHHPPRSMRKALREALGRSIYEGRDRIAAPDIVACIGQRDAPRRCGFL